VRISFGARSFLFLADIEKEAERRLVEQYSRLETDVVKVAHHGSKTSSTTELIAATRAKFAVISVGLSSPYGHPRAEVIERWKSSGAKVLTNGENGTSSFSTDGDDLQFGTFIQPAHFR
jgi:beta-lactamase superfamily II metal-dependent hydrolase